MTHIRPVACPAATALPDMPPLRGQSALRIAAIDMLDRTGGRQRRPFDPACDQVLTQPALALAGVALDRPRIMGILNVTPDSFSDGGRFDRLEGALAQARRMVAEGADILDIGGESTRPGAREVPQDEEIARVLPVIRALRADGLALPISIDTRKARVAAAALEAGANIVNDVSALTWDADLARVVADAKVPICLMHAQGTPQTMQNNPVYDDVRLDVRDWLDQAIARAEGAGIARGRIVVDPGIGFGKSVAHNLALLRDLGILHGTGCAILLGVSRKSFIGRITGTPDAAARVPGSVSAALQGAAEGAQILRVHDVGETRQALQIWQALAAGSNEDE